MKLWNVVKELHGGEKLEAITLENTQTKETERECLKSEAKNRYYVLREHFGGDETKALKAMAGCSWGQKAKNPADQTQRKNEEGVYVTVNKWPSKSALYEWRKEW